MEESRSWVECSCGAYAETGHELADEGMVNDNNGVKDNDLE